MKKLEIKKGTRYNQLTIVEELPPRKRLNSSGVRRFFKCLCDCGVECTRDFASISKKKNPTTSCGCKESLCKGDWKKFDPMKGDYSG